MVVMRVSQQLTVVYIYKDNIGKCTMTVQSNLDLLFISSDSPRKSKFKTAMTTFTLIALHRSSGGITSF